MGESSEGLGEREEARERDGDGEAASSGAAAARAPARLVSALFQNALNSKGGG
jgi:hypothetical protein